MMMPSARQSIVSGVAIVALSLIAASCRDSSGVDCTDEGGRVEISPSPVQLDVGKEASITVTSVTCGGRYRTEIYPTLVSSDPLIASVSNSYRTVRGQGAGSVTVSATSDDLVGVQTTVNVK